MVSPVNAPASITMPPSRYGEGRQGPARLASAAGAVALPAAVLIALWFAGGPMPSRSVQPSITTITLPTPPPPPKPSPPPPPPAKPTTAPSLKPLADPQPEGAAAPPNLRSQATPVIAPKPVVPRLPTDFAAAPIPNAGTDPTSGAADRAGPGTGSGGLGNGSGSGQGGSGSGGGGGLAGKAVKVSGEMRPKDYPCEAPRYRKPREVGVELTVLPSGRVSQCEVFETSGDRYLDQTTCRLARERFVFRPARDRSGQAVTSKVGWGQSWWASSRRGDDLTEDGEATCRAR